MNPNQTAPDLGPHCLQYGLPKNISRRGVQMSKVVTDGQGQAFISQPKHMLWVLKRTVSMDSSFEHPKHMLKLMGKRIFTILCSKILFI